MLLPDAWLLSSLFHGSFLFRHALRLHVHDRGRGFQNARGRAHAHGRRDYGRGRDGARAAHHDDWIVLLSPPARLASWRR